MAHKKAGGSTRLGRDSAGQRLGVKVNHGAAVKAGQIIIRQRGTKYQPGVNMARGKDDTLYAKQAGTVAYSRKKLIKYDGRKKINTVVSVVTA